MQFRKAVPSDLENIVAVFRSAVKTMEDSHIFQWDRLYPNREDFQEDIAGNHMYVGEDYVVLHRLCVNPVFQNRGIGTATVKYLEKLAEREGCKAVRLDVFSGNPYALKMYHALGYHIVGEVRFRKGRFYLMEKLLV
ncbi:MAG: GNAT family N-acetyltransferase [Lachnospiraceae bacterium]|nr:GNAT family N-acetyltransferase [Lachnospiraceae bacterium]